MENHLKQSAHNESLLDNLERLFPMEYNDWKVTLVFYAALHLIRAYAIQSNVTVGVSHKELQVAMKNQGASVPNLDVDSGCTNNYASLYSASRQARYDGFSNPVIFEASNRRSLAFCKIKLQRIKDHLRDKGLPI
jgi:hypothetical protein